MTTIASIGSLMVDVAIFTERMPRTGENLLADNARIGPGGKGANAAAAIARLGARSVMIGKVGDDDFGGLELTALRSEGVDVGAVEPATGTPTGIAFIIVNAQKENTILVAMGANDRVDPAYIERALSSRADTLDALLIDFEVPAAAVSRAVQFGKERHIPVIIDAGPPRSLAVDVWRAADVLSPNEHEAEAMVGFPVTSETSAQRAAQSLLDQGVGAVVLKLGNRGALLKTREETLLIPAYSVDVQDTTGAGDAFTAMLTLAIVERKPMREAVRWGNAAGALACTRPGTMPALPTRAEVEAFLAAHR